MGKGLSLFFLRIEEYMTRKDFELMAPVGSYESLYAALQGGADSVYFGVEGLNMRARSSANFTLGDLRHIVEVCTERGVKTYLTVNTVIYNDELEKMREVIDCARETGVTAIIASDLAAILYARSVGVEVHISTQCNVSNYEAVRFFAQYADVMVLARELVLEQVAEIHRRIMQEDLRGPKGEQIKIEMFAHGALCMAVSGKCYLSLHERNASANRGACNQICRRAYTVRDRDSEIELDIENEYIMSPKDLCTVGFINKLADAGVRVFKIEGRARSAEYVRTVCECYNEAICAYLAGDYTAEKIAAWKEEVAQHWDCFQVESFTCSKDLSKEGPVVGKEYQFNLVIDRHELQGMLGAEMVLTRENPDNHQLELISVEPFKLLREEGSKLYFELTTTPTVAGLHKMSFRVYPQNPELPHRMDFAYVRWIQL